VTLDEWVAVAACDIGVDPIDAATQRLVLDVAREVAHNTLRPGAPIATFLVGVAVGRGMPLAEATRAVTAAAHRLAEAAGEPGS
jgi:hypothetical protein